MKTHRFAWTDPGELGAKPMAHSFDASMPTPSPGSAGPAGGKRYRRDQFPPAPKSVRIVRFSGDEREPAGTESVAGSANRNSVPRVSWHPLAVWGLITAGIVLAALSLIALREAGLAGLLQKPK